jgi:UDP-N-acetylmuramate--alanine ligase
VHFVGVGGIGMSALARLFLARGKKVSGSDRVRTPLIDALIQEGVQFKEAQSAENISTGIDLVVYTEAMPHAHPELVAARTHGIETINYFEALGRIANHYRLIAIAGSHGKTTTTAMLIDIFEAAGLDPSAVVGSLRASTQSNYRKGGGEYFIAEACEYRRDFLSLTPDILVITNIEHEHVDYYNDLAAVQAAFRELVGQVRPGGFVIANLSDPNVREVVYSSSELPITVVDYHAYFNPQRKLTLPGIHNQMNAAAARAAAAQVGISEEQSAAALEAFRGTWRRFEYKGTLNGTPVYDDYAHHPTEVAAAIQGVRELYPERTLVVAYQPHTYSRTATLFNDFVDALSHADIVYVLPIYAAREETMSGVSSDALVSEIQNRMPHAYSCQTMLEAERAIREHNASNQVIVVMGAGSITELACALTRDASAVV